MDDYPFQNKVQASGFIEKKKLHGLKTLECWFNFINYIGIKNNLQKPYSII